MVIKTNFDYPPIPTRSHDWSAWVDGREEWKVGHGQTELAAILNLHEQLVDAGEVEEMKPLFISKVKKQLTTCCLCHRSIATKTAHLHQGELIGDECCWDERLRLSE